MTITQASDYNNSGWCCCKCPRALPNKVRRTRKQAAVKAAKKLAKTHRRASARGKIFCRAWSSEMHFSCVKRHGRRVRHRTIDAQDRGSTPKAHLEPLWKLAYEGNAPSCSVILQAANESHPAQCPAWPDGLGGERLWWRGHRAETLGAQLPAILRSPGRRLHAGYGAGGDGSGEPDAIGPPGCAAAAGRLPAGSLFRAHHHAAFSLWRRDAFRRICALAPACVHTLRFDDPYLLRRHRHHR